MRFPFTLAPARRSCRRCGREAAATTSRTRGRRRAAAGSRSYRDRFRRSRRAATQAHSPVGVAITAPIAPTAARLFALPVPRRVRERQQRLRRRRTRVRRGETVVVLAARTDGETRPAGVGACGSWRRSTRPRRPRPSSSASGCRRGLRRRIPLAQTPRQTRRVRTGDPSRRRNAAHLASLTASGDGSSCASGAAGPRRTRSQTSSGPLSIVSTPGTPRLATGRSRTRMTSRSDSYSTRRSKA